MLSRIFWRICPPNVSYMNNFDICSNGFMNKPAKVELVETMAIVLMSGVYSCYQGISFRHACESKSNRSG
jgi:hypothetical protein